MDRAGFIGQCLPRTLTNPGRQIFRAVGVGVFLRFCHDLHARAAKAVFLQHRSQNLYDMDPAGVMAVAWSKPDTRDNRRLSECVCIAGGR